MATHNEVAQNFAERKVNRLTRDVTWKGRGVDCDPGAIRSYGWWPMAYYLGEQDSKHVFLIRADRYSPTTSGHQASVLRHCKGPIVSFDALKAAGVYANHIGLEHIIDHGGETCIYLDRKDGQYFQHQEPYTVPNQGMFVVQRKFEDGLARGYWHILGGVYIEWEGRHLLCGLDEDTYFVSELPSYAKSVKDAYEVLKPPEVKEAESHDVVVLRQGEWFFIPTDGTDRDIADMGGYKYLKDMRADAKQKALPIQNYGSQNQHVCKHITLPPADHNTGQLVGECIYAKGTVYHRTSFGNRGTHRSLRLGNVWHLAVRNTEIASWSMSGKFD